MTYLKFWRAWISRNHCFMVYLLEVCFLNEFTLKLITFATELLAEYCGKRKKHKYLIPPKKRKRHSFETSKSAISLKNEIAEASPYIYEFIFTTCDVYLFLQYYLTSIEGHETKQIHSP